MRIQAGRRRKKILQLRAGISTASAELLLTGVLGTIDDLAPSGTGSRRRRASLVTDAS
jgi:hypothetical protein